MRKLWIENGFVYATNSFVAVRLGTQFPLEKKGFITAIDAMVAYEKTKEIGQIVLPELSEDKEEHPGKKIDGLFPETFITEFTVNRKYLSDLLEAMQEAKGGDELTILVPEKGKPVVLQNINGKALIMPMIK